MMAVGALLAKGIVSTLTTVTARRVAMNVLVVLGEWAVKQTATDLDDRVFKVFKDALDKQNGRPTNLYTELRKK